MEIIAFTVKSTPEQRYSRRWKNRLERRMRRAIRKDGGTVTDIGGGTSMVLGEKQASDNDYEYDGPIAGMLVLMEYLKDRGYTVKVWGEQEISDES